MISLDLAIDLRDAGLAWQPAIHDRFAIPGRDLDDRVFALNDMSTELRQFGGDAAITFNGAVEWSLDWILRDEAVWLPTETQLRQRLGERFVNLTGEPDGFRCTALTDDGPRDFVAPGAADAYGAALLAILTRRAGQSPG